MVKMNHTAPEAGDKGKVPRWCSFRYALAAVGFFGFVNLYSLRVNMSVAMVCMVNNTALQAETGEPENTSSPDLPEECVREINSTTSSQEGEFAWDKETQGIILGAFFWGYLITQIPGGWLAQNYGGKRVFGYFMLMTAIATLLTPVGARASPYLLVALRIVKGIGEGVVFPAMHNMWAKWAPPLERSRLIGFTYAGAQIGNVITFPISGLLCDSGFLGGWPAIFYVFGTIGVIWFVCWMLITSDSPAKHPRISEEERDYIESSIGASKALDTPSWTPWKKILTSMPVWAIVVAHTCSNWGTYTFLTNIPAYMREVLKFDIKQNGFYSAIPYICFWACINISGVIADRMRSRGIRTIVVRKIMLSCGTLLPALFVICTGYIDCTNPAVAIVFLSLGVGLSGFQYAGVMVNHVDIAPPFAGILFGLSNTFATIPGIGAPYAIGRITVDQTQAQWQIVFYLAAAIYTAGCIFFVIFADGEIQEWVRPFMFEEKKPIDNRDEKEIEANTKF